MRIPELRVWCWTLHSQCWFYALIYIYIYSFCGSYFAKSILSSFLCVVVVWWAKPEQSFILYLSSFYLTLSIPYDVYVCPAYLSFSEIDCVWITPVSIILRGQEVSSFRHHQDCAQKFEGFFVDELNMFSCPFVLCSIWWMFGRLMGLCWADRERGRKNAKNWMTALKLKRWCGWWDDDDDRDVARGKRVFVMRQ